MRKPDQCETMTHIRAEIDQLDYELVTLLAKRCLYIDRAADIKARDKLPARISERVEEVVDNVKKHAQDQELPPEVVEKIWRILIDWSIMREEAILSRL